MFRAWICPWILLVSIAAVPVSADIRQLPDPTRPPVIANTPEVSRDIVRYKLTSILFSAERRVAVINGRVVGEGEEIDGGRVTSIGATQVWLELADKKSRTLSLNSAARVAVAKSIRQPLAVTDRGTAEADQTTQTSMD